MAITNIVSCSLKHRVLVIGSALLIAAIGSWSALTLSIDAVPDITSPTVQINTSVQNLAPEEVEQLITFPIESAMAGLQGMAEFRSLSKTGLSQVTMVFNDDVDIHRVRQFVTERLQRVRESLPDGIEPVLAPLSTGLGEIYHYTVQYKAGANDVPASRYEQLLRLSQLQEYTIKPLLRGTSGVAEVNNAGGYEKQIIINPDLRKLSTLGLTVKELSETVSENISNAGGGLVEIGAEQLIIRSATRVASLDQIGAIALKFGAGVLPVTVNDVAQVSIGSNYRTGASTYNGDEAVVGGAIMLAGENSRLVARAVHEKLRSVAEKLPANVEIRPIYNRSYLVDLTIQTVKNSLFEGAVLVLAVLCAMLGNWRAAVIVASAIPLSMLFAFTGMARSRISGNLMSLGAIDFGLIIDGSVVMVENIFRHLAEKQHHLQRRLSAKERFDEVLVSAKEVANPMFFGVAIITIVYVPILALTGIEGKMFHPMAWTVIFALLGSLILSLTLMPVLCSFFLAGDLREKDNRLVQLFKQLYRPILLFTLDHKAATTALAVLLLFGGGFTARGLGAVFIPQLNEGATLLQFVRGTSVGLTASLDLQQQSERRLLEKFPEIQHISSRLGTAEIAMDPMGPNVSDTLVFYKPRSEWRQMDGQPITKDQLIELMHRELTISVPGQALLFSQPIQMRFNEIMAGARADLSVKIFGSEFSELERLAADITNVLRDIPGGGDIEFDPIGRSPMLEISPDRAKLLSLNVHAQEINDAVSAGLAGEESGVLADGNMRIPVVVRMKENERQDLERIRQLPVRTEGGGLVQLGAVATVGVRDAVGTITRESGQRRVAVLINPRGRDLASFVHEARAKINESIRFPEGYYYEFGGQYENLQSAKHRLSLVVPACLGLIFVLIFAVFQSFRQAALVFLCVPLAATGGIFALALRGIPLSVSAAVGFIALSGIAVLNGLMLISFINQLRREGMELRASIVKGSLTRLRPKIMTALVASFGFVPMAVATGSGAEVQRPLATVVIGGVMSSLFLTLVVLPCLYEWIEGRRSLRSNH